MPKPATADTVNRLQMDRRGGSISKTDNKPHRVSQARELVATIDKSHSTQLRVMFSEWRGQRKIEIADFTAIVAGVYSQAGAGITLDISKLDELADALAAAKAEARKRGWL
jgi:hypothetical protein